MSHEVTDIRAFLGSYSSTTIRYFPNPGNAGDSLIATATFQLLRSVGVPFTVPSSTSFDSRGQVVFYGGGGNLLPPYRDARDFIARHHRRADQLVLLPQSIAGNESLLAELGSNVTIICRERVSYEHVRRNCRRARVLLSEDLVLALNATEVLAHRPSFLTNLAGKIVSRLRGNRDAARTFVSPRYFMKDWRALRGLAAERAGTHQPYVLNAFRTDAEQHGRTPPDNHDLSRMFEHGCHSERLALYVSARFLSAINHYDVVRTNRLHVCIGSALLGKAIELHPNSYHKCKAVYELSLARRFPNVAWMGADGNRH